MKPVKRSTAIKTWIASLLSAPYTPGDGDTSDHLTLNDQPCFRVNLLGVVVNISRQGLRGEIQTITLDDGTGTVEARTFDPKPLPIPIGHCVFLIGRPRKYNTTLYLALEIVKEIQEPLWIDVRKKEVPVKNNNSTQTHVISVQQPQQATGVLLELIKKYDQGDGVDYDIIIKESNLANAEQLLQTLLTNGEIFQLRPGKIKLLE